MLDIKLRVVAPFPLIVCGVCVCSSQNRVFQEAELRPMTAVLTGDWLNDPQFT